VRRGYYVDLSDFPDGLGGQVQVRVSTRWEDLGLDYPVPRESWMAIRCTAPGLEARHVALQINLLSVRQVNVHGPPRITRASSTAIVSDVIAM
jgi:hypothetical protein